MNDYIRTYLENKRRKITEQTEQGFREEYREMINDYKEGFTDLLGTEDEYVAGQLEAQKETKARLEKIERMKESGVCRNFYYATVGTKSKTSNSLTWGFYIQKKHGEEFTVEYAKKFLNIANEEFAKGCPKGYYEETYKKYHVTDNPFTQIAVDMSYYIEHDPADYDYGESSIELIGDNMIGYYDSERNLLLIYVNDELRYAEDNGVIHTDGQGLDHLYPQPPYIVR